MGRLSTKLAPNNPRKNIGASENDQWLSQNGGMDDADSQSHQGTTIRSRSRFARQSEKLAAAPEGPVGCVARASGKNRVRRGGTCSGNTPPTTQCDRPPFSRPNA